MHLMSTWTILCPRCGAVLAMPGPGDTKQVCQLCGAHVPLSSVPSAARGLVGSPRPQKALIPTARRRFADPPPQANPQRVEKCHRMHLFERAYHDDRGCIVSV